MEIGRGYNASADKAPGADLGHSAEHNTLNPDVSLDESHHTDWFPCDNDEFGYKKAHSAVEPQLEYYNYSSLGPWDWTGMYQPEASVTSSAVVSTAAQNEGGMLFDAYESFPKPAATPFQDPLRGAQLQETPYNLLVSDEKYSLVRQCEIKSFSTASQSVGLAAKNDDNSEADIDEEAEIRSVLNTGRFKCREFACGQSSFGRKYELQRHYNSKHAANKRYYWCWVSSCVRSRGAEHRPFTRKDNLTSHIRAMHKDGSQTPGNTGGMVE
ncbi:hypothetical protein CC86DRAFT_371299 [Ophiobolus disseminans]|uniref:C2H2-type domain-containing protein n=1 Tax=Ophiobolus disseminans TaxID=1469910 RepID=A0A6A6ZV89_9PLEO|nr:hypothetical protein CC86DRAFT_371299 [Ophiobolus disseminans]